MFFFFLPITGTKMTNPSCVQVVTCIIADISIMKREHIIVRRVNYYEVIRPGIVNSLFL